MNRLVSSLTVVVVFKGISVYYSYKLGPRSFWTVAEVLVRVSSTYLRISSSSESTTSKR